MKKRIMFVSALTLLSCINTDIQGYAEDAAAQPTTVSETEPVNYTGSVIFEHYNAGNSQVSTEKKYTDGSEKLKDDNLGLEGLYRHAINNFLGWTDKPLVNGKIAEGAKVYSAAQSIKEVFPNGIPENAKLYGVYLGVAEVPNNPADILKWVNEKGEIRDTKLINAVNSENMVVINPAEEVSSDNTLPNTENVTKYDSEEKYVGEDGAGKEKIVIDAYKKDTFNEVELKAAFSMSKEVALLVHKNPGVGYESERILTKTYKNNDFSIEKPEDSNKEYTYVDLVLTLDPRMSVGEHLYLGFKSYTWRPLYLLDENKNILSISTVTGEDLGNTKDSFNSLVTKEEPWVKFKVNNTNGSKTFTLRTRLRLDEEKDLDALPEKILEKMEWVSYTTEEIKKLNPQLSEAELKNSVVYVKDDIAKEVGEQLKAGYSKDKLLKIMGYIQGQAVGALKYGIDIVIPAPIKKVPANDVYLGYVLSDEQPEEKPEENPKDESTTTINTTISQESTTTTVQRRKPIILPKQTTTSTTTMSEKEKPNQPMLPHTGTGSSVSTLLFGLGAVLSSIGLSKKSAKKNK
ncbi:LPXTG cell wall anchor domain-containing protein [Carnobacteriaceae bacterium zg-ZUI78]|nr:LPXTG cell wall anchor domain-containing protein [Carnobacteriaceae bacterium zg-ZUI78]